MYTFQINPNGSYVISFPAADWNNHESLTDRNVPARNVRPPSMDPSARVRTKAASSARSSSSTSTSSSSTGFKRGEKVEARYRGKDRWFKGEITEVQFNGRYSIRYDDGDRESDVTKDLIRRIGSDGTSTSTEGTVLRSSSRREDVTSPRSTYDKVGTGSGESLREGMKVEARYRGKSRYYPGRLSHGIVEVESGTLIMMTERRSSGSMKS